MSLSQSCRDYIGYTLYVTAHYGWGWSGSQINSLEVLENFELSLESLWSWRGELRGGIGKVKTEGHRRRDGGLRSQPAIQEFMILTQLLVFTISAWVEPNQN